VGNGRIDSVSGDGSLSAPLLRFFHSAMTDCFCPSRTNAAAKNSRNSATILSMSLASIVACRGRKSTSLTALTRIFFRCFASAAENVGSGPDGADGAPAQRPWKRRKLAPHPLAVSGPDFCLASPPPGLRPFPPSLHVSPWAPCCKRTEKWGTGKYGKQIFLCPRFFA
jgi:hypothetical protein